MVKEEKVKSEEEEEEKSEDDKERLHKEIESLKKIINDTLFHVRLVLSDLENPFKYISKYLSGRLEEEEGEENILKIPSLSKSSTSSSSSVGELIFKESLSIPKELEESKEDSSKSEKQSKSKESSLKISKSEKDTNHFTSSKKSDKLHEDTSVNYEDKLSLDFSDLSKEFTLPNTRIKYEYSQSKSIHNVEVNDYYKSLLAANFLIKLFGKNNLKNFLFDYLQKRLIDEYTYFIVLDSINKLYDNGYEQEGIIRDIKPEDHIITIYILNQIKSSDPWIFYILLLLMRRFYEIIPIVRFFGEHSLLSGR